MKKNTIIFLVLILILIFIIGCNSGLAPNINTNSPGSNTITNAVATSTTTTTTTSPSATTQTTTSTISSSTTTTTQINNNVKNMNIINFYTKASSIMPEFSPLSSHSFSIHKQSVTTFQTNNQWGSGNPLYSVFFSLREFIPERDEGIVDRSNLHKLIYDVNSVYSGMASSVTPITEQEISPPFSKLPSITCDMAINDEPNKKAAVMKENTDNIEAILTWIWTDSQTKNEYGIARVDFNKNSKDISIEMTYSVDYDLSTTSTDYNMRCSVEGNVEQYSFKFKYIIGDTKIVAQGMSEGSGSYILFKYTWGNDSAKYIVVPSDADESFFISENSNPTNIYTDPNDLPATVSSYKDWVVSTDFFTSDDMMTNTNLLNVGNDKSGTIFIKYN